MKNWKIAAALMGGVGVCGRVESQCDSVCG